MAANNNQSQKPTTAEGVAGEGTKKIGSFKMSTGGGTPLAKGEKLADHPEAKRVQQPRDEDGQFTYNSANNIELKYGPSRGTTIPPFLKGIKLNCVTKKDKNGKNQTYAVTSTQGVVINGETFIANMDMTVDEFIDAFKQIQKDGTFGDIQKNQMQRKKGKKSKAEKAMISSGQSGVVNANAEITDKYSVTDFKTKLNMYSPNNTFNPKKVFKPKAQQPAPTQQKTQQPAPTQQNAQQSAPTQQNAQQAAQPTQPSGKKKFDTNAAKSNPKQFMSDNYDDLNDISDYAKKKGFDIDVDDLVNSIGNGDFSTIDEIKSVIDSL